VAAPVFWAGIAAAIPVKAGKRIGPTRLKLATENISVTHSSSIGTAGLRPQPCAGDDLSPTRAFPVIVPRSVAAVRGGRAHLPRRAGELAAAAGLSARPR
jgi:hypothetical protein